MSSAYHPQTDGQTKRVNQCMETYLHCFVHACPARWSSWLSLAEFWYNTSSHSALGRSPFEVLYGHAPCHFGIDPASVCAVPELSVWLLEREVVQNFIRQHLLRADKGRSERSFQVGDQVYLKMQPHVQTSLAPRANQKLAFKYFGPYRILERIGAVAYKLAEARIQVLWSLSILERIGAVAYKLALPATVAIHPVFHVSQLKEVVGDHIVSASLYLLMLLLQFLSRFYNTE